MAVMTYEGWIENGQIRLASGVTLPENAKVFVVVPDFVPASITPKFDLEEMISRIPPDYQTQEEDSGKPVGKEVW